jgi:hypothetical protein
MNNNNKEGNPVTLLSNEENEYLVLLLKDQIIYGLFDNDEEYELAKKYSS